MGLMNDHLQLLVHVVYVQNYVLDLCIPVRMIVPLGGR